MDIHIEAPKHPSFESVDRFYRETLDGRYAQFEFIKKMTAHITQDNNDFNVKLTAKFEREGDAFVKGTETSEDKALREAIKKMDHVVRKYKSKHYHGI